MLKKLDHIGIAVDNLEASVKKYEQITGKISGERETRAYPIIRRITFKSILRNTNITALRRHELLFLIDF